MTVLEAEDDTDERSAPPRKKFCLSLSGRSRSVVGKTNFEPTVGGGVLDRQSISFGTSKMLNGCRNQSNSHQTTNYDIMGPGSDGLRIATLCNLGNTCFLNSVLYTLRFTPSFLHNLHHLAIDLSSLNDKHLQIKMKSSSLGRTGVSLSASGNRSMSSKDLLALAGPTEYNKPRIQVATEKLHELFIALRESEVKENSEPFQPGAFLQALREVNNIFEGNQQQDAHELLVCLLDNIRETFQLLVRHRESQFGQTNGGISDFSVERAIDSQSDGSNITSSKRRTKWKKVLQKGSTIGVVQNLNGIQSSSKPAENGYSEFTETNGDVNSQQHRHESRKCFISEDFEGVSLLRTTCLECEQVTERKEIFCDICVPIDIDQPNDDDDKKKDKMSSSEVYRRAVVTSELLCERDKYWCEHCLRLNEARRAVCFPSLPRLLILQLKRFSTAAGSMEKINNYMPTPLDLECFCEECYSEQSQRSGGTIRSESRHLYQLYSVIMHQGATMTAGHYVAYSRLPDESMEYCRCNRDIKRPNQSQHSTSNTKNQSLISKFLSRSKPNINESKETSIKAGCRSAECCGIRQGKPLGPGMWLECDDETVRVIQVQELQDKLAHNPRNSATPYLLFYVKTTT